MRSLIHPRALPHGALHKAPSKQQIQKPNTRDLCTMDTSVATNLDLLRLFKISIDANPLVCEEDSSMGAAEALAEGVRAMDLSDLASPTKQ
ncbi:hypothetical protein BS47DRAFT_1397374 [Hydnum rufescens UP504]|uniref:Uncharacterized protein n=1 Tax=Hydnum rufescens UP504 TaxID=1448309 RepID=A0A9P6DNE0_9AGAM|nr:hypothetical protein BS47DRAFT_1397374 [Hydnum rufescens UP504]